MRRLAGGQPQGTVRALTYLGVDLVDVTRYEKSHPHYLRHSPIFPKTPCKYSRGYLKP